MPFPNASRAAMLYGFETNDERRFEKLLDVKGIGLSKAAKAMVFSVSHHRSRHREQRPRCTEQDGGISRRLAESMVEPWRGQVALEARMADRHDADVPETGTQMQQEALVASRLFGFKAARRARRSLPRWRATPISNPRSGAGSLPGEQPSTGVEVVR